MTLPWIKIDQYKDRDNMIGPDLPEYVWQALFACQIGVPSHQEWVKLKWGFNASALFDETLERQKLFLESQYAIRSDLGIEDPDHRTLAFRYINRPGEGLLVTALGKILARTQVEAEEKALAFYFELKATFPYDYTLVPARTRDEYDQIAGNDILEESGDTQNLAQIKRMEIPLHPSNGSPILQGLWQSSPRAHEQIWRFLAITTKPVIMNISIRCTVLYETEREMVLKSAKEIANFSKDAPNQITLLALKRWSEKHTERRLTPWKKFFYMQIQLASNQRIDENIFRILGTSLSLTLDGQLSPGYQVIIPRAHEVESWLRKLRNLDFVYSGSYLSTPRLTEIADMEEVFAVMRLPYLPPENGFPDMQFVNIREENNEI